MLGIVTAHAIHTAYRKALFAAHDRHGDNGCRLKHIFHDHIHLS
jgi:hypothetical protein